VAQIFFNSFLGDDLQLLANVRKAVEHELKSSPEMRTTSTWSRAVQVAERGLPLSNAISPK
jgi:hypothetical protein